MYLISVLITVIIFTTGVHNNPNLICSSEKEVCVSEPEVKYLFYEVSYPEGFNLRRDVYMRFAVMFAEMQKKNIKRNWQLVLPPFHRLPHWRNENYLSAPLPWSSFFDLDSLKSYAPVVELTDVFNETLPYIEIDRLYILQNYENPFENGHFAEKWEVSDNCDYLGQSFWGYVTTVFEVVCIKFQGRISQLWEVVALHPHDRLVMIYNAEIPLHESYGTKTYWDCRKSMQFNQELVDLATEYIAKYFQCYSLQCTTYISVHWRRGDYTQSRKTDIPSIIGAAKQINKTVEDLKLKTKNVFIATDASASEIQQLQTALRDLGYIAHFYLPRHRELSKYRDGGIAIIEQIICSHAAYFIGSHESTFSYRIQEEREIIGFSSNTTFNRLCPDKGRCEPPSKWTIIH